jgi:hypothetical protein
MLQPQKVTAFPAEHMLTIVMYGLRPDASKHQIRVCACLEAHSQSSSTLFESIQGDPDNYFIKLQLRWKILRNHRDTDLYWFCDDDPASLSKNSGIIITEWLLLLLVELDIPTPPGVKWTGHSLRRGLAYRFKRCYGSIARVRCLASSRSSGSTTYCPFQQ